MKIEDDYDHNGLSKNDEERILKRISQKSFPSLVFDSTINNKSIINDVP